MRRLVTLSLISLIVPWTTGCGTVIKRTVNEVKGSSSDATPIPGSGGSNFARFSGVEIQSPRAESGGLVPSEFNSQLVANLRKELTQGKEVIFTGGSPTLTIEPHVMWFNKSNALFPSKYAVAIFLFHGDGADLGSVQIVTKSEATGTGVDDLAESMAKEMAKYIKKHGKEPRKK